MVLTKTKKGINPAETFCEIYNELFPNKCAAYVSKTRRNILKAFLRGEIRVLVIIGRLLEGFDHKPVKCTGNSTQHCPNLTSAVCSVCGKSGP